MAFFFVWLFSALIISMFDIKLSLGLMIAYRLLVPYSSFGFASIPIEYNYILLMIFFIFLFRESFLNNAQFEHTLIMPFSIFAISIFLGAFFSNGIDFTVQLTALRSFIIGSFLIPVMLWQVVKTKADFSYFARLILVCLTIMLIYGLYCFITGTNPYVSTLAVLFNKKDINEVFSEIERSGIIGKIQSTTFHPMLWSVILSMALFASSSLWLKKKSYTYIIFVFLLIFNLLVCNVRTGIVASVLGMAVLFANFSGRAKMLSFTLIIVVLMLSVDTSIFGSYQPYVDSIIYFNDPDKNVGGSSLDIRMVQFGGAVSLWEEGGILFGNGFGWCGNYYALFGDHPILFAFESIIYVLLIENGVLGILLYGFLYFTFYKINWNLHSGAKLNQKTEFWLINSFITAYIIFIVITGQFGFNLFLIFLVLMFLKTRLNILNDDTESIEQ